MSAKKNKFKEPLENLVQLGDVLTMAMQYEQCKKDFVKAVREKFQSTKQENEFLAGLPSFTSKYQDWYTEAQAVIKQLIPGRLADFVRLYDKPKNRKDITHENYVIEDYLTGLSVTRNYETVVGPSAAIPRFEQQLQILKSAKRALESKLFDLQHMLQADLFDSELDAAVALNKNGFTRGAGAMAGVVLEHHLAQVCYDHSITICKKNPTISDFNDALKDNGVTAIPVWRQIQHLGDLRNLCDHKKSEDPSKEQIEELINGVTKITKTIF